MVQLNGTEHEFSFGYFIDSIVKKVKKTKTLNSIGTIEINVCPNEEIKIEKPKMREEKEMNKRKKLFSFRKSIELIQSS